MRKSFWNTLWSPGFNGNPWAYVVLAASQAVLAFMAWRRKEYGVCVFFAVIAACNMTKLMAAKYGNF